MAWFRGKKLTAFWGWPVLGTCRTDPQVLRVKEETVTPDTPKPMQEFFDNVSRYPRYFITITLGIFFFLFEQLKPLLKRPVTAVALIGLIVATLTFLTLTLQAMLGLNSV